MYKADSKIAEEFIDHQEILETLEYARSNKSNRALIEQLIDKAARCKGLSHREAALLLECDQPDLIERIFHLAQEIKHKFYGNRIVMFAPLYLSNYCVNGCVYCPYHLKNKTIARKKLTQEEIRKEVIALQDKWKTIGFAPKKSNVKIFERFRAACDEFFKRKAEFFKSIKESMAGNLEKKKALCEKAEALKESTDWKATADILSKLQKEWKTIGPVPKKYSDAVWKRFIAACDYFFEQKNKATSSQRSVEQENMVQKKAIIEKLNTIDAQETPEEDAGNTIRELMKEWNSIGHVPFKEKDKLYKQYHGVIDKLFDKLNLSASQKKLSNFKSSISKEGNLYREREKLVRAYENMKNEIQTYENNLGFLTSSSKKGSSLVTEMNRKVEKLKADLELILKKIEVIDQSMKDE